VRILHWNGANVLSVWIGRYAILETFSASKLCKLIAGLVDAHILEAADGLSPV
jgi:hypothetical protein